MEDAYPVRLVVQRQDAGYQAKWVEDGGQESETFDLVLPLTAADAADLRWYFEDMATSSAPGRGCGRAAGRPAESAGSR